MTNWPDYRNWSEEQINAYELALGSLIAGDLHDLAQYLRAGYPLGGSLAQYLADAIEHNSSFDIKVHATGGTEYRRKHAASERNIRIGVKVHVRLETAKKGEYEAIIREIAEMEAVGTTAVREALAYFRKQLNTIEGVDGFSDRLGAQIALANARAASAPG